MSGYPALVTHHPWILWCGYVLALGLLAWGALAPPGKQQPEPNLTAPSSSEARAENAHVEVSPNIEASPKSEVSPDISGAQAIGNQLTVNLGDLAPRLVHPVPVIHKPEPQIPNLSLDFVRTKVSAPDGVFIYDESGTECVTALVHNLAAAEGQAGFDARSVFGSLVFTYGTSRTIVNRACWLNHDENEIWIGVGDMAHILIGFPYLQDFTWVSVNNPQRVSRLNMEWNRTLPELERRTVPWHDDSSLKVDVQVISNAVGTKGITFRRRQMRLDRRSISYHGEWIV